AGAGVKPGFVYGATDEFGYHAVENRMHIHDLHATILHLMGLNHEKLTYRYAGRDFRLTDVAGVVANGIIARHENHTGVVCRGPVAGAVRRAGGVLRKEGPADLRQ